MTKLDLSKKIWFFSTAFFVLNYSLYLFLFIVKIPLKPFPVFFNLIALIISYSVILFKLKDYSGIRKQTNLFCIIYFITFPNNFLLFPFYLLGVYNLMSFILSNKKLFENKILYEACMSFSTLHVVIGRMALMVEVVFFVLIFMLYLLRLVSIGNLLTYGLMIRQQYAHNHNMKSVVQEMKIKCLQFSQYFPNLY